MSKIIHTVGNMVDIPDVNSISKHEIDNSIVFVGKMNYEPNIVAVTYFVKEIFPSLKNEFPNLNFFIVGASPDHKIKEFSKLEGITVTGYVDSIEQYFKDSTVVVAPMLTGAGIQNKIIQAMAYGCCVATTEIGAEGLMIEDNEIAIINNNEDWIKNLSFLLRDRETRKRMGEKARNYVINNLSKEKISQQFWSFINSAL